jgi:hypothetical protein
VDDILSFLLKDVVNDHIEQELKGKFEINSIGMLNMILGDQTHSEGQFYFTLASSFCRNFTTKIWTIHSHMKVPKIYKIKI